MLTHCFDELLPGTDTALCATLRFPLAPLSVRLVWGTRQGCQEPLMADPFDEGSRSLQERFGTTALADRIDSVLVQDTISTDDRAFLEARDMSFLATADGAGRPTCSYTSGEPGFVRVLDERTVAFPSYDGNGMCLSGQRPCQPRGWDAPRLREGSSDGLMVR